MRSRLWRVLPAVRGVASSMSESMSDSDPRGTCDTAGADTGGAEAPTASVSRPAGGSFAAVSDFCSDPSKDFRTPSKSAARSELGTGRSSCCADDAVDALVADGAGLSCCSGTTSLLRRRRSTYSASQSVTSGLRAFGIADAEEEVVDAEADRSPTLKMHRVRLR